MSATALVLVGLVVGFAAGALLTVWVLALVTLVRRATAPTAARATIPPAPVPPAEPRRAERLL